MNAQVDCANRTSFYLLKLARPQKQLAVCVCSVARNSAEISAKRGQHSKMHLSTMLENGV